MLIYNTENANYSYKSSTPSFALSSFDPDHILVLFYFIQQYIDSQTAINMMACCNQYTNGFDNKHELLKFWRYIYTKYWGRIIIKNKHDLQNKCYKFWMDAFNDEYYHIRYIPSSQKMYVKEYENKRYGYESRQLYIFTKHRCLKKGLLKTENFINSNWYLSTLTTDDYIYCGKIIRNIKIDRDSYTKGYLFKKQYCNLGGYTCCGRDQNWYLSNIEDAKESEEDFMEKRYCTLFQPSYTTC